MFGVAIAVVLFVRGHTGYRWLLRVEVVQKACFDNAGSWRGWRGESENV